MSRPLSLFEGFGIELEYVLVDRESLDVRPIADRVLHRASGDWSGDHDDGPIGWSNELVLHVLELKTNGPVASLDRVDADFGASLGRLAGLLADEGARPMPTGMHPWMEPARETRLWPHEYAEVYRTYDRIFDCRRHGWANVQAVHLNLPFADDEEFGRLLAAARFALPLLPALAASSPLIEGCPSGLLDTRLEHVRENAARVPAMAGELVPEPVYEPDAYRREVLEPIARQLAPLDAERVLAGNEWTNARGVIARFDRDALEIRVLDMQECPRADLAIAAAVAGVLRALVEERWLDGPAQRAWPSASLVDLLRRTTAEGPRAAVRDAAYAEALRCPGARTAGEVWRALVERTFDGPESLRAPVEHVLSHGTLAERILAAAGEAPSRERLRGVYGELCDCLVEGRTFEGRAPRTAS